MTGERTAAAIVARTRSNARLAIAGPLVARARTRDLGGRRPDAAVDAHAIGLDLGGGAPLRVGDDRADLADLRAQLDGTLENRQGRRAAGRRARHEYHPPPDPPWLPH